MQTHWPKDDEIFSWDPENMEKYWELCRRFDHSSTIELPIDKLDSPSEFETMVTTRLR